jgi:hypothetical protein
MNVAIHKENYAAYEERRDIIHNQQSLFREIQLVQDPLAQLSPVPGEPTYIPYAQWQDENGIDWAQLEALSKGGSVEEISEEDEEDEAAVDDEDEYDDE